ncbi:TonB-dependent receptor [Bacteroides hominis]|uniref:TonB-dependent receptor n=1 Tax=Bacteroides hominis TaxID=2763023 RepID=UPI0039C1AA10
MKKNNYVQQLWADNPMPAVWKKFPLTMKLLFVFSFCFVGLLCASDSYAQRTIINVEAKNQTVKEVLSQIESQSEFSFFYNDSHVDINRRVSISTGYNNIFTILNEVFKNTNVKYVINNKKIILSTKIPDTSSVKQTIHIKGKVTDISGDPVIGATVMENSTKNGVITDLNGNFTLDVSSPNTTITVSYVGYVSQTVKAQGDKVLSIILKEDMQTLDEVVVVGFGTQKKVNLTGSVSTVNADELLSRPVSNVSQALQGLVPGMNFSYASDGNGGEIGADMKVNIRGTGTIGAGSNAAPLILIDGMEGNMNMLNPNDIESISVLKDAAASSIYGSRAPFGVVLITTKKGKAGKATVNYNNSFRWSQAINLPHVADAYTYAMYFNTMQRNDGVTAVQFDDTRLQAIKDYASGVITTTTQPNRNTPTIWDWIGNTDTDWYDVVFGGTAFSQEHSLSVSGGTEKIQYYFSGNYMGQEGMMAIRRDQLQRYSVTGKINVELFPWLHMNYSMKYMRKDYSKPTAMTDNTLYQNISKRWPMEPTVDPNGYPMGNTIIRPILYGGDNDSQTDWLYQQFQVVVEPVKNWKIFGEINYKTIDNFSHTASLKVTQMNVAGEPYLGDTWQTSKVTENAERTNYFNTNVYSDYSRTFAEAHHVKVMAGFQAEMSKWRQLKATKQDLISESVPNINAATGKPTIDKSQLTHWATAGFFGRVNYDYKERYLFEMNLRYDGTSRFARNKRWNLFPSFSAGWNVAREAFMEPYNDVINNLKVRGSWGELGNQNTTNLYPYIQLMKFVAEDPNSNWLIENKRPNTANAPDLISALLGWETMRSWNIGFDLGLLSNRLTVSLDWFNRKTINMVGPAPELPVTLGTNVPKVNNADMQSTGFELDLGWRDQIRGFNYGVHLLLSDDRQKILRYPNKTGKIDTWYAGEYSGNIWGFETIGIAKSQEEMDAHLASLPNGGQDALGTKWGAGDIMYRDLNGDGKITSGATLNDPGDRKIIGNSSPRFKFGLDLNASWKGFDARLFFQGVAKRDAWLGDNMFWGATGDIWQSACFTPHLDFFREGDDFWSPNTNAYFPRPLSVNYAKNQQAQTRYLQNAAYVRLKNLQIGYTIPARITSKMGISNLRIFFSGENLFTLTGLPQGFDPETIGTGYGSNSYTSGKTYPLSRTFSTGFSVNF